ncbi:MAG: hypothetical protein RL065_1439 [Bacteroidota bacterium]|jgi:uncharacterized damage-inducible protein DinB
MTKKYFLELAAYNCWANNRVISWLNQLTDEQYNRTIISSFSTIKDTCIHIAGAEKIWLERWHLIDNPIFLTEEFKGSKQDLITIWQKASADIQTFIEQKNEAEFQDKFSFKRLNGDLFYMDYEKTFTHIFNHSTFHRGQLVTMLRQAGFTKVESTDALTFFREIEK